MSIKSLIAFRDMAKLYYSYCLANEIQCRYHAKPEISVIAARHVKTMIADNNLFTATYNVNQAMTRKQS